MSSDQSHITQSSSQEVLQDAALAVPHYPTRNKVKLRGQLAELLHTETDRHLQSPSVFPYPPGIVRPSGTIRGSGLGSS